MSAEDILLLRRHAGERVVIIGGGLVGCEVADLLSTEGKTVVLVEMLDQITPHPDPPSSVFLNERLKNQGVEIWTSWKVTRIDGSRVVVEKDGQEKTLGPFDSVVLAAGYKSSTQGLEKIRGSSLKTRVIGDALSPRDALEAIYEGSKAGREI
jgi:pyruvate/2-oxoglutarate dehydrogenase complex dihydrolipoamide dehydrogenase (E3) component